MDKRGGLGVRSSNGSGDMVAFTVASTRASSLWEGDVEGPVTQGGTGSIGGGTSSGGVKNCKTGLGEVTGGAGNSPRVTIRGVLTGDDISITMLCSSGPAMASGMSWGDDRQENGYVTVPVNVFTGVDGALFLLVDIALIVRDGKVTGHEGDGVELSKWRVLILLNCFWKSANNSSAWRSLELVHES